MSESWQKLVDALIERNLVKRRTLQGLIHRYRATGATVEKVLVENKVISKSRLLALKSEIHKLEAVDLKTATIDLEAGPFLPQAMSERYNLVCIGRNGKTLVLAGTDPLDAIASDFVRMRSGFEFKLMLTYAGDVEEVRRNIYQGAGTLGSVEIRDFLRSTPAPPTVPTTRETRRVSLDADGPPLTRSNHALPSTNTPIRRIPNADDELAVIRVPGKKTSERPAAGGEFKPVWKVAKETRSGHAAAPAQPSKEPPRRTVRMEDQPCALCQASLNFNGDLPETTVLQQLLDGVMQAVKSEGTSLLLLEADGRNLFFKQAAGANSTEILNMVVPLDENSIAGWVVKHREPRMIKDAQIDPLHNKKTDHALGFSTRDMIAVPVLWQDRLLGVMEAVNRKTGGFGREDVARMEVAAAQAALVLHHSRTVVQLNSLVMETVDVLVEMLQAQGTANRNYLIEVAQLATALGREAGLPESDLEHLCYAGLLHDIGMAGIPRGQEADHAARGARILGRIPMLSRVVPLVRFHHERWDGKGPGGVVGDNIPLAARVVAVAIDWCENRPTNPRDLESYKEYFDARFGSAFDPQLREAFERALTTTAQVLT